MNYLLVLQVQRTLKFAITMVNVKLKAKVKAAKTSKKKKKSKRERNKKIKRKTNTCNSASEAYICNIQIYDKNTGCKQAKWVFYTIVDRI